MTTKKSFNPSTESRFLIIVWIASTFLLSSSNLERIKGDYSRLTVYGICAEFEQHLALESFYNALNDDPLNVSMWRQNTQAISSFKSLVKDKL